MKPCRSLPSIRTGLNIPGQEQLNMDYVCGTGAALPLADASRARETAAGLLSSPQQTAEMTRAAARLARPGAAAEILRVAAEIAARRTDA